jgi:hypothetical protein
MGHMVSLTSKLLSSHPHERGRMEVIGPEHLMAFATGRSINIEGTDTKCFEDELYALVLRKMEEAGAGTESFQRLLTSFLFDQRAYGTAEVAEIIGAKQWKGLEPLWLRFLNDALAKMGHRPGLLLLRPVSRTTSSTNSSHLPVPPGSSLSAMPANVSTSGAGPSASMIARSTKTSRGPS